MTKLIDPDTSIIALPARAAEPRPNRHRLRICRAGVVIDLFATARPAKSR